MATKCSSVEDARSILEAKKKHTQLYHAFAKEELDPLRQALLSWYDVHKRDLPWRKPHGIPSKVKAGILAHYPLEAQRAYEVWISEIMLQQTQVKTVIAYYLKWMQKWPTVFDLANATLSNVNEVWAGLGYYSRARRIHEAAIALVANSNGILPRPASQLVEKVSGVGRYTAGAIASIAYGEKAELVDGNVVRVLSRLRSIGLDPKSKAAIALHWDLAKDLLDPTHPGDFNQALMEHGATICVPQNPLCTKCPVQKWCTAYAEQDAASFMQSNVLRGQPKKSAALADLEDFDSVCSLCGELPAGLADYHVTRYPTKVVKKAPRLQDTAVCILERRRSQPQCKGSKQAATEYLLVQRPSTGLLGGLWEFPSVDLPIPADELAADTAYGVRQSLIEQYLKHLLGHVTIVQSRRECGTVPHLYSHIKQTYWVEHVVIDADTIDGVGVMGSATKRKDGKVLPAYRWVASEGLSVEAMSTGMKKVLALKDQGPKAVQVRKRAVELDGDAHVKRKAMKR